MQYVVQMVCFHGIRHNANPRQDVSSSNKGTIITQLETYGHIYTMIKYMYILTDNCLKTIQYMN